MSWLVPAEGPVRDRLAGVIARLAAEYGAPVFAPHVTINRNVDAEPDAAARVLERVMAGVSPFEVTLPGFGYEPEFFRSLYLRAEPHPRSSPRCTRRASGLGVLPGRPYRPHLSLLYSRDLPEERKPAIAEGVGLALPVTIRVDGAEIWGDFRDEVTRWRRVARVPLAG